MPFVFAATPAKIGPFVAGLFRAMLTCLLSMEPLKVAAKRLLEKSPILYKPASVAFRSLGIARAIRDVVASRSRIMMGARPVVVSYPGDLSPRWQSNPSGHPLLAQIVGEPRAEYARLIASFAPLRAAMERIPDGAEQGSIEPCWNNGYFAGLDAAALYGVLATQRPKRYFEIGSGYSTKLARRTIRDQHLPTTILSIDPSPQASIDGICDTVIRQRLEDTDLTLFDQLETGDILFFDGSHHAFMSSDVVVFWLEILPRLQPGVLVHIHDIFLPYDYPIEWTDRYYSEQYLAAVALLAPQRTIDLLFPSFFIHKDPELSSQVTQHLGPRANSPGGSFWVKSLRRGN
jgi:hypothetical protein